MHPLIDTHTHLHLEQFDEDRVAVVERALAQGIEAMIVPATRPEEFEQVLTLATRFPSIHAAIGVHPHHAAEVDDAALSLVDHHAAVGTAIAVGEAGLDYYYDFAPRDRQRQVFREQLAIARTRDLPAVVHNRDSDDDLLQIIESEQDGSLRIQLHCFSSGPEVLTRALELGAMISFTGNVTFAKARLDEVVQAVPDDRIMIETDAPYLAPVPMRGRRNEPAHVALVARKIADIRGQTVERIRQMTTENARRFFRLATLLVILLSIPGLDALAQDRGTTRRPDTPDSPLRYPPVRPVDTTARRYSKLFGVGPDVASSTYISGSTTKASAVGFGFWITGAPLEPLGIDWLHLDLIYNHVSVAGSVDSAFDDFREAIGDSDAVPPPNAHNTLDLGIRLIANPSGVVNFFGTFGLTFFHNEFGVDRYMFEADRDGRGETPIEGWEEDVVGLNGGLGVGVNLRVPYVTIVPTGELRFLQVFSDRPLKHRPEQFRVSQVRASLLLYPDFQAIFR